VRILAKGIITTENRLSPFLHSHSIKNFPSRGRSVPEVGDDNIRELFVYNYRVIYQIQESQKPKINEEPLV